jgi:hypothetical protein
MEAYEDIAATTVRARRPADRGADHLEPSPRAAGVSSRHDALLRLQRTRGNQAVLQLLAIPKSDAEEISPVLDVVGGGSGQPLEPGVRSRMEAGLGADFGDVRIHTDQAAAASAASVQAHAYTVGNEIVFGPGQYQPATPTGERTLAHELTHVVQQRSGPVEGTARDGGIAVSDPSDRFEQAAETRADAYMAGSAAGMASDASGAAVQRQAALPEQEEEEPTAQGLFVQRQEEPEDDEEMKA